MNRARVLPSAVIALCCASTACYKIKSSGFILRGNTASLPGISEGGKLRWVSMEAQDFVIHIDPVSPCAGGANDLASSSSVHGGKTVAEAGCTVATKMEGYYVYSIVVANPAPNSAFPAVKRLFAASTGSPATSGTSTAGIAFHVDYCPLCKPSASSSVVADSLQAPVPALTGGTQGVGPDIVFGCDAQSKIYTVGSTPSVYPGQVVLWSPVGPEASAKWQADQFAVPFCQGVGQSFGTIDGGPKSCTVKDQPTGGLTSYRLRYQSATQSCYGNVSINVVPTP